MTLHQMKRFNKSYSRPSSGGKIQVEARLMYLTHQLEKGLSHANFRFGFGHEPMENLAEVIERFREFPDFKDNTAYKSALGALKEYLHRHEGRTDDLSFVHSLFSKEVLEEVNAVVTNAGGSLKFNNNKFQETSNLKNLLEGRHSVREYAARPVTYPELEPALTYAMRSPSVCNRQSTRVRVIFDKALIGEALNIQEGFNGYALPPVLLLLTADNRAFMTPKERNEGFTDGGLFGMSLLLALQDTNLAACPLNTMMKEGAEKATRQLLGIPSNEELVMYIAVGHFKEVSLTCRSTRYPVEDIVTVMEAAGTKSE
jgi:nitroreductase